jgi:Fe-S-cluster containining protein
MSRETFYAGGLRFACMRCSRCCRHTPGYVFLSEWDVARLAAYLGMSGEELRMKYCRQVAFGHIFRVSLTEKPNLDCVFWENGGCRVYKARPLQCRSYPFWISCLSSEEDWRESARQCPGIGKGPIHPKREIDRWLRRRREESYIEV